LLLLSAAGFDGQATDSALVLLLLLLLLLLLFVVIPNECWRACTSIEHAAAAEKLLLLHAQKRSDGHISLASRLLFWPYHAGLRGKLWIQRRKSTEPLFDQVTEQL
jgi:hypothetical protein